MSTVVLGNILEYNRRMMTPKFLEAELAVWDAAGVDLADMALFWGGSNSLVITPTPLQPRFVQDVVELLGYTQVITAFPAEPSSSLCADVLADRRLFHQVVTTLKRSAHPRLIAWGPTKELYKLVSELQLHVPGLTTPGIPSEDRSWLVDQLESKVGFRQFASLLGRHHPEIRLAEGFVFSNCEIALEATENFWARGEGFVLKASYGTGGFSQFSQPAAGTDLRRIQRILRRKMAFDSFWTVGPVVLEQLIEHGSATVRSVTTDYCVGEGGALRWLGTGQMFIRNGQQYSGIVCGPRTIEEPLNARLQEIGRLLGTSLANHGYRGLFDLDFVVSDCGVPILTELNARRASPSHAFEIGRQLHGEGWSERCVVWANDHLKLSGAAKPCYSVLSDVVRTFNESVRHRGARVIPTIASASIRRRTPYIGYAIVAPDVHLAIETSQEFEGLVVEIFKTAPEIDTKVKR